MRVGLEEAERLYVAARAALRAAGVADITLTVDAFLIPDGAQALKKLTRITGCKACAEMFLDTGRADRCFTCTTEAQRRRGAPDRDLELRLRLAIANRIVILVREVEKPVVPRPERVRIDGTRPRRTPVQRFTEITGRMPTAEDLERLVAA